MVHDFLFHHAPDNLYSQSHTVGKVFLINNQAAFYAAKNLLINVCNSKKAQILNEPCARCLEALLDTRGELVSHDRLYQAAWGDAHGETTPNTLYQNILLARKALRAVTDSPEDFIITVPRKGFLFNERISVIQQEYSADSSTHQGGISLLHTGSPKDDIPLSGVKKMMIIIFSLVTFCILSMLYFSISHYHNRPSVFADKFNLLAVQKGCHLYINKDSSLSTQEDKKWLTAYPILIKDCDIMPHRYITPLDKPERILFLTCTPPKTSGRECITHFIREAK